MVVAVAGLGGSVCNIGVVIVCTIYGALVRHEHRTVLKSFVLQLKFVGIVWCRLKVNVLKVNCKFQFLDTRRFKRLNNTVVVGRKRRALKWMSHSLSGGGVAPSWATVTYDRMHACT